MATSLRNPTKKNPAKSKKKYTKPFKVIEADPDHLKNVIKRAKENEKYWRALGQGVEEDSSTSSVSSKSY